MRASPNVDFNEHVARVLAESEHLRIDPSDFEDVPGYSLMIGAFGTVKVAKIGGQIVAVKELRITGAPVDRARFSVRFARELRVWARLDHPNLIKLFGFCLDSDMSVARFICPFYAHGHIRNYIDSQKPEHAIRLRLAKDTALGLQYLHDVQIVHGDLKELNVLVDVNTEPRALLCDFGVAKMMDPDGVNSGLTTTGMPMTIRFASPELMDGSPPSLPSDIWAWGCLFLKIVADIGPYEGTNDKACMFKIFQGVPPANTSALPLPASFQHMLEQCWDQNQPARPRIVQCIRTIESLIGSRKEHDQEASATASPFIPSDYVLPLETPLYQAVLEAGEEIDRLASIRKVNEADVIDVQVPKPIEDVQIQSPIILPSSQIDGLPFDENNIMPGPNASQSRLRQYDEIRRAPPRRSSTPEYPIRTYEVAPALPEPAVLPQAAALLSRPESRNISKRGKKSRVAIRDLDEHEPETEVRPRHASTSLFAPMPIPSVAVQPASSQKNRSLKEYLHTTFNRPLSPSPVVPSAHDSRNEEAISTIPAPTPRSFIPPDMLPDVPVGYGSGAATRGKKKAPLGRSSGTTSFSLTARTPRRQNENLPLSEDAMPELSTVSPARRSMGSMMGEDEEFPSPSPFIPPDYMLPPGTPQYHAAWRTHLTNPPQQSPVDSVTSSYTPSLDNHSPYGSPVVSLYGLPSREPSPEPASNESLQPLTPAAAIPGDVPRMPRPKADRILAPIFQRGPLGGPVASEFGGGRARAETDAGRRPQDPKGIQAAEAFGNGDVNQDSRVSAYDWPVQEPQPGGPITVPPGFYKPPQGLLDYLKTTFNLKA